MSELLGELLCDGFESIFMFCWRLTVFILIPVFVMLYYLLVSIYEVLRGLYWFYYYKSNNYYPSSVWFQRFHSKSQVKYVFTNLYGWSNIEYLWEYWFTQPISEEEFNERLRLSDYIAPRGIDPDQYQRYCQPIYPLPTDYCWVFDYSSFKALEYSWYLNKLKFLGMFWSLFT